MEQLAEQLLDDANKRFIDKNELLEACLEIMTEDQLYEMAIKHGFIKTEVEDDDYIVVERDEQTTPEKIIDAVLARYGE
jgi:ribonucleotide monophosphatase NagD (HAD superfamily)